MFVVPSFPHLRNIEMEVNYVELIMPGQCVPGQPLPEKWKSDPDVDPDQVYLPMPEVFTNGESQGRRKQGITPRLREPPPLDRFPRRYGLLRVYPDEPDYEAQCRKQGLLSEAHASASPSNPEHNDANGHGPMNGITPPRSDKSKSTHGGSPHATLNGSNESASSPIRLS